MTDDLQRAAQGFWAAAERRSWILGKLGHPDGTIAVANRTGWVYVRVGADDEGSVSIARNAGKVPLQLHLPIKMRREGGVLVIHGADTGNAQYESAAQTGVINIYGVPQHTHASGSGLEYEVEAMRLEPGRLRWNGGMAVYVEPFRFYHNGAWDTWMGGAIALTAYAPATSGHWGWVLVGVNPATNTAVTVAGTSQIYATPLTIDLLDAIAFSNYIPCGAVKVRNDDTTLTDITRYQDAHEWFGRLGLSFNDDEGDPEPVADVATDGASTYAARRDHVHSGEDYATVAHNHSMQVVAARRESSTLAQAIAASTLTAITGLDTIHLDTTGTMAPASPDDSIVIPVTGYYNLWGSIASDDLATTEYLLVRLQINGTGSLGVGEPTQGLGAGTFIAPIAHVPLQLLAATDTVRVLALTNRGGGCTIDSAYVAVHGIVTGEVELNTVVFADDFVFVDDAPVIAS